MTNRLPLAQPLLTSAEVAALTKLSENTLRNLRSQRRIPFVRLAGGAVRYDAQEIQDWIASGAQPALARVPASPGRPRRAG